MAVGINGGATATAPMWGLLTALHLVSFQLVLWSVALSLDHIARRDSTQQYCFVDLVASGDVITLKTQLNKTGNSRRVLNIFCNVGGFAELSRKSDSSRLQQRLSVTVVTQFCEREQRDPVK